jgi:hypothetical protein
MHTCMHSFVHACDPWRHESSTFSTISAICAALKLAHSPDTSGSRAAGSGATHWASTPSSRARRSADIIGATSIVTRHEFARACHTAGYASWGIIHLHQTPKQSQNKKEETQTPKSEETPHTSKLVTTPPHVGDLAWAGRHPANVVRGAPICVLQCREKCRRR